MEDRNRVPAAAWMRAGMALSISAIVGPGLVVAVMSYGLPLISGLVVALVVIAGLFVLARRLAFPATSGRGIRILFAVWVVAGAYGGFRMTRLGIFMHDATRGAYAFQARTRDLSDPELTKPFYPKHNCFTCYMVAAELAHDGTDNIYSPTRYVDPDTESQVHKTIGDLLHVDRYQYPPTFLPLPGALRAVTNDFFHARAVWFGVNGVLLAITFLWLVAWIDRWTFRPYWMLWPGLLVASTVVGTLQIGNAHLFIVLLTVLAFLSFETRRFALGGLLLAFGVVGKIFPGVLLLYLMFQRRWRAVIWTCAGMTALTGATFAMYGIGPFEAFLTYQIPRLVSGEAFSFAFEYPRPMLVNGSVMGIGHKLAALGLVGEANAADLATTITWVFSAILVVVVVWLGVRQARPYTGVIVADIGAPRRIRLLRIWIVLTVLAQLRSPFLPWGYGHVASMFLIFFVLPLDVRRLRHLWWAVAAWVLFAQPLPLGFGPSTPAFDVAYSLVGQSVVLLVCLAVAAREAFAVRDRVIAGSADSAPVPATST